MPGTLGPRVLTRGFCSPSTYFEFISSFGTLQVFYTKSLLLILISLPLSLSLLFFFFFFFVFWPFLGPLPRHREVPRLGVHSELWPRAYARATATWDLSHVCDLYHIPWQHGILNPQSKARDRTCNLTVASWICQPLSHDGNSPWSLFDQSISIWHKSSIIS